MLGVLSQIRRGSLRPLGRGPKGLETPRSGQCGPAPPCSCASMVLLGNTLSASGGGGGGGRGRGEGPGFLPCRLAMPQPAAHIPFLCECGPSVQCPQPGPSGRPSLKGAFLVGLWAHPPRGPPTKGPWSHAALGMGVMAWEPAPAQGAASQGTVRSPGMSPLSKSLRCLLSQASSEVRRVPRGPGAVPIEL